MKCDFICLIECDSSIVFAEILLLLFFLIWSPMVLILRKFGLKFGLLQMTKRSKGRKNRLEARMWPAGRNMAMSGIFNCCILHAITFYLETQQAFKKPTICRDFN